ncbi:MAG: YceD family protein, partial [Rhodoferax sp.]
MKPEFVANRLDVKAFAQAAAQLAAQETLQKHERLLQETKGLGGDYPVNWAAAGELRPVPGQSDDIWLQLKIEATLPLTCQRCLGPVDVSVAVDRAFRFVADEETAAAQDDDCEEDLLVVSYDFDLAALVEDEVLMELPLVPMHGTCPVDVKLA